MRIVRIVSRLIVGMVFIFSGFVKAVDPLGSAYKFSDYFNAFGIGFLENLSLPLAVFLSSVELVIGISLFLGYRMKIISWLLLAFMSFFTALTLVLALTNPVHDCGCFGDALILTNWQTFWKNVVLMIFTLLVFAERHKFMQRRKPQIEYSVISVFFILAVGFSLHAYRNLPVLDFRPYKTGTFIPDAMIIPEGAPASVYETTLVYRNTQTGKDQEFSLEDFPRDDPEWEFVDSESVLVSPGYEPPIHDFNIYAPDGSDLTSDLIGEKDYSFVLIAYDLARADGNALQAANDYYRLSLSLPDLNFYAITASVTEESDSIRKAFSLEYDFCQADEITLKTIIRSNPGLVLIKDGTILAKWHYRNMPGRPEMAKYAELLENFPFYEGADLERINTPPAGSRQAEYRTVLYYRNIGTGELSEFSMENFPRGDENWLFEDSRSEVLSNGFKLPLDDFMNLPPRGGFSSGRLLQSDGYTLLFFINDISSLPEENLKKIIKLGGMAGIYLDEYTDCFAFVPGDEETAEEVAAEFQSTFSYIPVDSTVWPELGINETAVVLVRDGKVIFRSGEDYIPDPESLANLPDVSEIPPAGNTIFPMVVSESSASSDRMLIILFILTFFMLTGSLTLVLKKKE